MKARLPPLMRRVLAAVEVVVAIVTMRRGWK